MSFRSSSAVTLALTLFVAAIADAGPLLPPVIRGSIDLGPYGDSVSRAVAIDESGRTLYVSADAYSCDNNVPTVFSVDVTDPAAPKFVSSGGLGGCKANGLVVSGSNLYVASWASLLRTFDLSSATPLQTVADVSLSKRFGWGVSVVGNRAFVGHGAETESGFYVFDVTNPAAPSIVTDYTLPERGWGLGAVKGSYALWSSGTRWGVLNVSDEKNPKVLFQTDVGHPVSAGKLRGNFAFVPWSDPQNPKEGGLHVFDLNDPTQPKQVGYWEGGNIRDVVLMGDLGFVPTCGNGVLVFDLSDPTKPTPIAQPDIAGNCEIGIAAADRFIYVGTASASSGQVHVIEVLTESADDSGPGGWANFSPRQTSWSFQASGDALPSQRGWAVGEGDEKYAHVEDGVIHVVDDGTAPGEKLKWVRSWDATSSRGSTVQFRARCPSADPGFTPPNVIVEDGRNLEELSLLPDRLRLIDAKTEVPLDGTAWHTFRFTMNDGQYALYIDEASIPALKGALVATSDRARVWFGAGSSPAKQEVWFDDVSAFEDGDRGPSLEVDGPYVDVAVDVQDLGGKGTPVGIAKGSVKLHVSHDRGVTEEVLESPMKVWFDGADGALRGQLHATGIPLVASQTDNVVRFELKDTRGNVGFSPWYVIRSKSGVQQPSDPDAGTPTDDAGLPEATADAGPGELSDAGPAQNAAELPGAAGMVAGSCGCSPATASPAPWWTALAVACVALASRRRSPRARTEV